MRIIPSLISWRYIFARPSAYDWKNKRRGSSEREMVYFIGLEVLVSLKKRSKRLQDKIDLEMLQELTKSKGLRIKVKGA